jgi:ribokinase
MDLVLAVKRPPQPGETLVGGDLALFPGGKGANQACAAGKLGGKVRMVGMVGPDPFGPRLIESLATAGVDTSAIGWSDRSTGTACISVLPDGENMIIISPGANAALSPDLVLAGLAEWESGDYLLCQLESPLETVLAAFTEARQRGGTTILDPAPMQPLPKELLAQTDILTPNQTEAAGLLSEPGVEIITYEQAAHAANRLRRMGPRTVIMKLGAAGCYIAGPEGEAAVPGFAVHALDTTAAGDTFNGALAVALAEGLPLLDAARFANAAAAISVTRTGAQASIPTREEAESFLATIGG